MHSEISFSVEVAPGNTGVGFADTSIRFASFEKDVRRALFITDSTPIESAESDGVLTITNGKLRFSVSPGYSDAVYSLVYDDDEWLYSRYPTLEPYSWWNPFVGGLKSFLERMGNQLALREKITASFTSKTDTLGNVWTGIRADVTVGLFDDYKGMRLAQYYLTLPGVPVLCHFACLENGTGRYHDAEMFSMLHISGKEGLTDLYAATANREKTAYRLRMGSDEHGIQYDRLVRFSHEGETRRARKLYVFKDSERDQGMSHVECDMNVAYCDINMKGSVPDGGCYTTKPIFCIITGKELCLESLTDLEHISFS